MKKIILMSLFLVLLVSPAIAEKKETPKAAGPSVVYQAKFPITLQSKEYELQSSILEFAPGAGVPQHMHGGHVLVIVLEGEILLKEKGKERTMKTGESWTENPGDLHSVVNAGKAKARVAVSTLLPKGTEATTIVK